MPKHLDADAQKEWKRLVPMLLRIGVLTEADGMALSCLCQAYSTMVKAQKKLNETGMLLKTPSGYIQQSPLISIINNCADTIAKISREFGLTPAARTRIMVNKEPDAPQGLTARSIIDIARKRSSGVV
jgi:P27 family predicted phage terminase small subunit